MGAAPHKRSWLSQARRRTNRWTFLLSFLLPVDERSGMTPRSMLLCSWNQDSGRERYSATYFAVTQNEPSTWIMRRSSGRIGYRASCGSGSSALAANRFTLNRAKPIPWTNFAHCLPFTQFVAHSVGDGTTGSRFEGLSECNSALRNAAKHRAACRACCLGTLSRNTRTKLAATRVDGRLGPTIVQFRWARTGLSLTQVRKPATRANIRNGVIRCSRRDASSQSEPAAA
jgi:hypothetical protein